ncbi:MAG: ferritin-like domain-containing protein [Pseudacidovorax sp.]|nr:ferritin-like domain-containing protein [Pseudacidovorax sp.]
MNLSMTYAAEHLMDWLRDAHAMEEQAELLLQTACDRLGSHPVLKARLQAHHQQTREQARMLSECIHRRGGSTSGGKEVAGRMSAMVQSLSARPASDEVINVAMTCYAFEHYEVATYRVMVAVAEMAQDPQTRHVCEEILRQEEATSGWLAEHLGRTHAGVPCAVEECRRRRQAVNPAVVAWARSTAAARVHGSAPCEEQLSARVAPGDPCVSCQATAVVRCWDWAAWIRARPRVLSRLVPRPRRPDACPSCAHAVPA